MALDILIIDDEEDIRELVAGILEDEGYDTRTAKDSDTGLSEIEARLPSLLILDVWLQGSKLDGLELLELLKSRYKELPVVVISGHGNIETAVAAIKKGAYDFIEKPFEADQLILTIQRATEAERLRRENEELKKKTAYTVDLTGRSSAINTIRQSIEKVAMTNSRILIQGAPGAGKEVVARQIHARSHRSNGNFIVVAAASMEPHRMEEELFGVEQNGGVVKTGLFEKSHGGTLFIDEVADMPLPTQAKILRALTDQSFERVNGNTRVRVDVRVISATSRSLLGEIEQGRFREDLFHRLNVVPLMMPSLAERREDIPMLTQYFLDTLAAATGRAKLLVSEDAMAALQAYDWPGNVRQLKNIIERVVIMGPEKDQNDIGVDQLPMEIRSGSSSFLHNNSDNAIMSTPLREARESFEREYLKVQINRFSGNISRTAAFIGMERSALHRKLKSLGLNSNERSPSPENAE
ncbi:sigma-54 dependent transcriptional regulator [Kordiimonas sp. SCSIO 12610]|uniref:nitrogen assimilation response regulator NtrX n=1 Tax=Kordiimonas sp. SCSIO 12610 TaxID=2829597 RepID=UPI00210E59BE|nr:sigma-54 dependent transcriptional regulator [Kordiimonas sp. SCSIO 12610]UTW54012.1 sigma-54-dependent Fis family transcriptional regulator [Kordiimonas sp. SCSIO 12610]